MCVCMCVCVCVCERRRRCVHPPNSESVQAQDPTLCSSSSSSVSCCLEAREGYHNVCYQQKADHTAEVEELQWKLKVLQSRLDRQKQQTDILRQQHKTPSVGAMATPPEASPHIVVKVQHMYMYMCSVVTYSLRVD